MAFDLNTLSDRNRIGSAIEQDQQDHFKSPSFNKKVEKSIEDRKDAFEGDYTKDDICLAQSIITNPLHQSAKTSLEETVKFKIFNKHQTMVEIQ